MKKMEQDIFYKFHYLSGLNFNSSGSKACFVVTKADLDKNDYTSHLYVYDGKGIHRLTNGTGESMYTWLDDETILFAAKRGKQDSGTHTTFYTIRTDGGEAEQAFEVYAGVSDVCKLNEGFLFQAELDVNHPDYYRMSKEERDAIDQEIADNADYQVIDEYPFFFNGAGFINKTRNALFQRDDFGNVKCLTPVGMNVENMALNDDKTKILLSGVDYETVTTRYADIYEYNLKEGTLVKLYDRRDMQVTGVYYEGDKKVVVGTFSDRVGAIGNSQFYELKDGSMTMYIDSDTGLYNSIGTDCCYGSTKAHGVIPFNGSAYAVTVNDSNAELWKAGNGTLETVISFTGAVDDYTVAPDGKILVIAMAGTKLEELYAWEDGKLKQLSDFNEEVLKDCYIPEPEPCYLDKEPFDIHGWVLKPVDYDPSKKYPAILDIHGGPKCSYGTVYYHEMAYWTNLGYFVFFCNPRGGDGRGDAFCDLRKNWGKIDYEDLMDFTDHVLECYPQIDKDHVAVTGGSYGGYMTNWIVGQTDRFCCAATQRSISNMITEVTASDYGWDFPIEMEFEDLHNCAEELWDMSPLKYANNVKTPILFIHSFEDYRCPLPEGLQYYTAIRLNGIATRMCLFKGENHELSRSGKPTHRSRRLKEITSWIEKYCKEEPK